MAVTDADRQRLYTDLERALGPASAETLMAILPSTPFESLASKSDITGVDTRLDALETRMDALETRMDSLESRMTTDFDRLYGMARTQFVGTMGGFFALLAAIIGTRFFG